MPDHIPSDEMYKYIDCRYTGVVVAAKRARQLMLEDPSNSKGKPLLRAFDELMSGKLSYRFASHEAQQECEKLSQETVGEECVDSEQIEAAKEIEHRVVMNGTEDREDTKEVENLQGQTVVAGGNEVAIIEVADAAVASDGAERSGGIAGIDDAGDIAGRESVGIVEAAETSDTEAADSKATPDDEPAVVLESEVKAAKPKRTSSRIKKAEKK